MVIEQQMTISNTSKIMKVGKHSLMTWIRLHENGQSLSNEQSNQKIKMLEHKAEILEQKIANLSAYNQILINTLIKIMTNNKSFLLIEEIKDELDLTLEE